MDELWAEIPSFEQYDVSNYGAVRNHRGRCLATGRNQSGILYVNLFRHGRQYNRAISPLVAGAFLETPPHHSWDTPIHRNGNRVDVHAENLMWRPRWFAIEYHQQIVRYADPVAYIRDVETGEEGTLRVICMRHGLIPRKVFTQATNYSVLGDRTMTVWPTGQMFELI